MNTIVYSEAAIRDLDRVWDEVFAASKSNETARRYISGLMDKVEQYKTFPSSAAPLNWGDMFTGYHFVVYKAYMVFFRIDGETIKVARVLFGKSDYLKILF